MILKLFLFSMVLYSGSCVPRAFNVSSPQELGIYDLASRSLGIEANEFSLTFDDGPVPGTLELAKYLADKKVPATFFFVGANIKRYPNIVKQIANMKIDGKPAFIIANHTVSHPDLRRLERLGRLEDASREIAETFEIQKQVLGPEWDGLLFFRPPYGSFAGSSTLTSFMNTDERIRRYIGPIFWNVGGSLDLSGQDRHAADWACWSSAYRWTVERCLNAYLKESRTKGRGVVLMHDVHSKTIELAKRYVDQMLAEGRKFVPLDKLGSDVLQKKFKAGTVKSRGYSLIENTYESTKISYELLSANRLYFKFKLPKAVSVSIYVDEVLDALASLNATEAQGSEFDHEFTLKEPGNRVLTVRYQKTLSELEEEINYTFSVPAVVNTVLKGLEGCLAPSDFVEGSKFKMQIGPEAQHYDLVVHDVIYEAHSVWSVPFKFTNKDNNEKGFLTLQINQTTGFVESGTLGFEKKNQDYNVRFDETEVSSSSCPVTSWFGTVDMGRGKERFSLFKIR